MLQAVRQCLASLFTTRAIVYRNQQGIDHQKAALSIVVQEMVESKVSGVAFSVEPTSGFDRVVRIDTAYGLGEAIVQGMVSPDTFLVTKDGIIVQKELGSKEKMIVYHRDKGTKLINTNVKLAHSWSIDEAMVRKIAKMTGEIEKYYGYLVDVELALDKNNRLWTLQVRPETKWQILREKSPGVIPFSRAKIDQNVTDKPVISGLGVSPGAASGKAVFLDDGDSLLKIKPGDILMAKRTDPDMVPAMQVSGGVVTAVGGRTSHAAIVSRELGIPAVVGIENLKLLKSMVGKILTIDGDSGLVFAKKLSLIKDSRDIDTRRLPKTRTRVGLILADVNQAFRFSQLAANEYKNQLIGGDLYEPDEDNPMLGNRGTGRYLMGTNLKYLGWELQALVLARTQFKAENLELMLPFVRTLAEASIAMSEIPSNALIATEFIKLFDGFSIGSNDMTQFFRFKGR